MFDIKVQNEVQKHYDKLVELGYNVVGVFLYGSQNYELDYEGSDVDTKAIVLPTLSDIVLNKQPISTTVDMGDNCLCDVKDIRKMFECFKKQNINFIELLFTKYYVMNDDYAELYQPMLDNNEIIARYNNYASLNCMCGMALEKYNALTHPYPSIKDKIDRYGYDNKQFHHVLRMREFMERYISGEKYLDILIPYEKGILLAIKKEYIYSVDEAKSMCRASCDYMKQLKDDYMATNPVNINHKDIEIMDEVCYNTITHSIREEIL